MATFTVDQISVYFNNVKLPLISGDDAVSIPSPFSYDTIVNDRGGLTAAKKIEAIKINTKCVRGDTYLSNGFISDAIVNPATRKAIMSGNSGQLTLLLNDGSGRKWKGIALPEFGEIQARGVTMIEIKFIPTNGFDVHQALFA